MIQERIARTPRLWITDSCNRCPVGPVLEESSRFHGKNEEGRRHRSPSNVGGHGTPNISKGNGRSICTLLLRGVLLLDRREEDSGGYSRATPLLPSGSFVVSGRMCVYSNWTFLMKKACSFHASFHSSNDSVLFVRIEWVSNRRVANEGNGCILSVGGGFIESCVFWEMRGRFSLGRICRRSLR